MVRRAFYECQWEEIETIMDKATLEQYLRIGLMISAGQLDWRQVQAIIEGHLTPSITSIYETQARRLFDLKFGDVLGCSTFKQYLYGTDAVEAVPQIQAFPETHVRLFGGKNVWLVDGRVAAKIGVKEYYKLVGVACSGEDDALEHKDPKLAQDGVYWMIGQDGYRNRGRAPDHCREQFQPFEVGMDWAEGGAVYAQNPDVIADHFMVLPGSVHRANRDGVACVGRLYGTVRLFSCWSSNAHPRYGSASRGM